MLVSHVAPVSSAPNTLPATLSRMNRYSRKREWMSNRTSKYSWHHQEICTAVARVSSCSENGFLSLPSPPCPLVNTSLEFSIHGLISTFSSPQPAFQNRCLLPPNQSPLLLHLELHQRTLISLPPPKSNRYTPAAKGADPHPTWLGPALVGKPSLASQSHTPVLPEPAHHSHRHRQSTKADGNPGKDNPKHQWRIQKSFLFSFEVHLVNLHFPPPQISFLSPLWLQLILKWVCLPCAHTGKIAPGNIKQP